MMIPTCYDVISSHAASALHWLHFSIQLKAVSYVVIKKHFHNDKNIDKIVHWSRKATLDRSNLISHMPEHHFRFSNDNNRDNLGRVWKRKTQKRGYSSTRAHLCSSGIDWACAFHCSARESIMASNEESNTLDDFDIEEVINWEEHNYASKVC